MVAKRNKWWVFCIKMSFIQQYNQWGGRNELFFISVDEATLKLSCVLLIQLKKVVERFVF